MSLLCLVSAEFALVHVDIYLHTDSFGLVVIDIEHPFSRADCESVGGKIKSGDAVAAFAQYAYSNHGSPHRPDVLGSQCGNRSFQRVQYVTAHAVMSYPSTSNDCNSRICSS